MSRRSILRRSAIGCTVGLTGCTGIFGKPPIGEVKSSLVDIRNPSLGVNSATIPVIVEYFNPTNSKIPSPTAEYNIFINGSLVGTAKTAINTIQPEERVKVPTDLIVEYGDAANSIVSEIKENEFRIKLEGVLKSEGATKEFTLKGSI